jgi:hypothetical protein
MEVDETAQFGPIDTSVGHEGRNQRNDAAAGQTYVSMLRNLKIAHKHLPQMGRNDHGDDPSQH